METGFFCGMEGKEMNYGDASLGVSQLSKIASIWFERFLKKKLGQLRRP